jgi:hypothetical protein
MPCPYRPAIPLGHFYSSPEVICIEVMSVRSLSAELAERGRPVDEARDLHLASDGVSSGTGSVLSSQPTSGGSR